MFYVPYTGTSLYKTLYYMLYHHHLDMDKLSFDALKTSELKQLFEEIGCFLFIQLTYMKNRVPLWMLLSINEHLMEKVAKQWLL